MLSIDEAIEQFKYDAECNRADLDLSYAEHNEQIAEWLEELKMYKSLAPRELVSEKQKNERLAEYSKGFDYGFKTGYNKSIDDFVKMCDEVKICEIYDCVSLYDIEHIAEQLKEMEV